MLRRTRWRGPWFLLIAAAALSLYGVCRFCGHLDRPAWQRDLDQLVDHLSTTYANLEWNVEHRSVELSALLLETEHALAAARDDSQAEQALQGLLGAFADPHLRIRKRPRDLPNTAPVPPPTAEMGGAEACGTMGFSDRDFEVAAASEGDRLADPAGPGAKSFPTTLVPLGDGRLAAILRIGSFREEDYASTCSFAWERFRAGIRGECDAACQDRFLFSAVPNALLSALADRLEQLRHERIDLLVLDLRGNGGGSDWVEPAARMFGPDSMPCPRMHVIKHAHWTRQFEEMRDAIARDLAEPARWGATEAHHLLIAKRRADQLLSETREPCERGPMWRGYAPTCSLLTQGEFYACGLFPHPPPGEFSAAGSRDSLSKALSYDFRPGVYLGPLVILVDHSTSSAAEYFTAMLEDAGRATVVGEKTKGAGCGYSNGGVPVDLANSGLRVEVPDCTRMRNAGTNEVEGISPRVALAVHAVQDDRASAKAFVAALQQLRF